MRNERDNFTLLAVIDALETFAGTDRPVHRIGMDSQFCLDLIHQIEGVPGFPSHFVNEGKDGNMTHDTALKKLAGLRFHTLGGVDDHDGGIGSHEGSIRIL